MSFREKLFGKTVLLEEPFPIEKLKDLNFGNADGARDDLIENAFVETRSVSTFLTNQHSIIIGQIGSGKSALFRLLKEKNPALRPFSSFLIIPIEESISFKMMKAFIDNYFQKFDTEIIYRLIWKFQILVCLCEKISNFNNFPLNKNEREINDFLKVIDSKGTHTNIIDKFKFLVENYSLQIDATLLHFPLSADISIPENKNQKEININLDKILDAVIKVLKDRQTEALVIIDKIDRFVAGEEYNTQRKYIEGLLDVEDDMSPIKEITFKIFIRADLFSRLNFTGLGYDKVNDNTLKLSWSSDEIISFMANRILVALKSIGLIESKDILITTDLTDYHLAGLKILRLVPNLFPKFVYKLFFNSNVINQERKTGLMTYLNKSIITKVFPRRINHIDSRGKKQSIDIFNFLSSHFKDGHEEITPRHLLIFLKEVQANVSTYYINNPDQSANSSVFNGNTEWELFKADCVYEAYKSTKQICVKNIGNADDKWTRYFVVLQSKKGNKTKFDFKWLRSIFEDLEDSEIIDFMSFLHVIGFFKISEHQVDMRKRKYSLPTLYI